MDVTKPCKFIWFGDIYGPKPYRVLSFRRRLSRTHRYSRGAGYTRDPGAPAVRAYLGPGYSLDPRIPASRVHPGPWYTRVPAAWVAGTPGTGIRSGRLEASRRSGPAPAKIDRKRLPRTPQTIIRHLSPEGFPRAPMAHGRPQTPMAGFRPPWPMAAHRLQWPVSEPLHFVDMLAQTLSELCFSA